MANTLYPQLLAFTLYSSGASLGDTTLVLSSFKTIDGVQLTMANFGDKGFMTLEPGAGSNEEQISFSGVSLNSDGLTTTLSGVKNVDNLSPYTETSGLAKPHSGGSKAVVAITSGLLNQFANKGNAETVTGLFSFPSSEAARPRAIADTDTAVLEAYPTFGQLARTSFAGTVNGSTIEKGIFQEATVAQQGTADATGSTGARLIPANANLVKTSSGASDENKIAVLDATGTFANGFIDKARTWGTVQSFTANNCQITSDADSSNDAVRLSLMQTEIPKGSLSGTSGEAITAGQGVYIKASDGKLWKTVGTSDEPTFRFVGIANTTVAGADLTVSYSPPGHHVTGLSGLTAGAFYYVSDTAGTLATTPGTRFARVGIAVSTTVMLVTLPHYRNSGSQAFTSVTSAVQTCGFYPAKITLAVRNNRVVGATDYAGGSYSVTGAGVDENKTGTGGATSPGFQSTAGESWNCLSNNTGTSCSAGAVITKTVTGFTLNETTHLGSDQTSIYWVAESL